MPLPQFHPAVQAWFARAFPSGATPAQLEAWPAIAGGGHALIAAPTGSGKTLAAFLAAIDSLAREGADGRLTDAVRVVYISPLKALSNDIQRNLEEPLAGISREMLEQGSQAPAIRAAVRTGDTSQTERAMMRRTPPHILVTTPESLYLPLTSGSGREMLQGVRTVIVDEIHAVAQSKRGSHLALTLERLCANASQPVQRIGLSATQKPIEEVARFLVGTGETTIVNSGHVRERDINLVMPTAPLEAVMAGEVWATVYDQIAGLINDHHTTLIFANTRRMVERVSRHLAERLGEEHVAAHHGSLSKETRFDAEQRLKAGKLKVMVATASLELGIDIGDVELVCQLGTPRSISVFLQRVGRANHSVGGVPKGRIFPSSRDELIDCTALLDSVRRGELDRLRIPEHPLDVLSQQIVAEVSAREYGEDELFDLVRRAYPYRDLERKDFDAVVRMLAEGIDTRRGRRGTYLHRDAVNRRLRGRKGARLTAITCGGAIPDNADYQVILEPAGTFVGTLNEDFAIESLAGDVFQLGNTSYRVLRVEAGKVRVEDAKGQPPSIPFWLGEAPARTDELSASVSRLRADIEALLPEVTAETVARAIETVEQRYHLSRPAAHQLVEYLAGAKAVLTRLPTLKTLVFERFFDESGGMQLIIHAPYGARINRAFGLSLRKKFCRTFNFELQAAATEDAIVLSLGETHSFELGERGALPQQQDRRGHADPGHARFAHVHRALALERQHLAGHPPRLGRQAHAAADPAHGVRRPDRRAVPRPDRLRGKSQRPARDSRSSAGEADAQRLPARGHGHRRAQESAHRSRDRRHRGGGARPAATVAAGRGNPDGAAVCLPRRCAAGRAPHQRRRATPLAGPGNRGRHGQARPGRHLAGARAGLARCDPRGRAARRDARHGRDHGGRGRPRQLGALARRPHRRRIAPRASLPRTPPVGRIPSGFAPSACR